MRLATDDISSGQNILHDMPVDIGEAKTSALMEVGEPLVVDP